MVIYAVCYITLARMQYKYELPTSLASHAASFEEFANGAAQCHARLRNGCVHSGLLVSNATAIIAMRGCTSLPFAVEAIAELFQEEEDKRPVMRGGWQYFDEWSR